MVPLDREFARSTEAMAFAPRSGTRSSSAATRLREQFLVQVAGEVRYRASTPSRVATSGWPIWSSVPVA